jgi:penicillin amidase
VTRRIFAAIFGALIVLAGGIWLYLASSVPQVDGAFAVSGLSAPVTIARDSDGVPLITAADDDDAAFGLGFAHAQDRLFQMDMQRRYGAGRLAEIFGSDALPADREMRVLGLYRAAEAELPLLPPQVRRTLDAYSAGVNAFLAERRGALPPEYAMLRFRPEPWRPADTLVWGKLMDLQLGGNYRGELLRARLARSLSPDDLAFLFPGYPAAGPTILSELAPAYRQLPLERLYRALSDRVGPTFASNNWVVDGAHSTSGKPLVANDPHLGFGAPGFWYLARLKTPEREIAGATVAGSPFVVIGHNDRIAWGFTTATADIEDLFVEKLDPANPGRYLTPDGDAAFDTRRETLAVRGGEPVMLTVRSTRHGPVLSDVLPEGTVDSGYVLALATTYLNGDDKSAAALWGIDRAQDWASFGAALAEFAGPPQNTVYGDSSGTAGFILAGRIPIRKKGDGWMPAPGWTGDYDWQGTIPFAELPQATNPPSGHFASANDKIVPDAYRYFISRDYDLPDRALRIEALLGRPEPQSPAASAAIQADTLSLMAERLVPLMTKIAPRSDLAREAVARLQQWDFRMEADEVEPLLFTAWLREFALEIFVGRLGPDLARDYWGLRPQVIEAILTSRRDWCIAPCEDVLVAALENAIERLARDFGPDMTKWQWGRAHIAEFPNRIFERVPLLRDWLKVAIPTPGGLDTVNVGPSAVRDDAKPFVQRFGAGLRIITDLAAPAEARMIAVPGQSGNPLSPHFDDLLNRWRRFDWLAPGRAAAVSTLTLEPAR